MLIIIAPIIKISISLNLRGRMYIFKLLIKVNNENSIYHKVFQMDFPQNKFIAVNTSLNCFMSLNFCSKFSISLTTNFDTYYKKLVYLFFNPTDSYLKKKKTKI